MSDTYDSREIGRIDDAEPGYPLAIGVRQGHVTIKCPPLSLNVAVLNREKAEEFARLFVAACWEAARYGL